MYRRWLIAGLIPLMAPAPVARARPATSGQYNPAVNTDLIRVADLTRAKAALELLPQARQAAATASLDAELQVLVRRVASSLAI
jgi:hypothetical protein